MNDKELIKYVKEEFVNSGFIIVNQWKNFIDYLQILLNKEREQALLTQKQEFEKMIDEAFQEEKLLIDNIIESGINLIGKPADIDFMKGYKLELLEFECKIKGKLEDLKQKLGEMK